MEIKIRRNGKAGAQFVQNTIRFPPHIYKRIREESEKSGRSLHAEILHRVTASFGDEFALHEAGGSSALESMAEDIKELRSIAESFLAMYR